jgi:cytochrome c biogenesis protein CcdA
MVTRERAERTTPGETVLRKSLARRPSLQNAVFALMLTLGFVGFAVFFTFFYTEDANHFLYGGAMALTALGWLVLAMKRWSAYRDYARA